MIVYHGASIEVENPDVSFSKEYLDFGKGFYVTTFKQQAEKWARRKAIRQNGKAFVNVYELNDDLLSLNVLRFAGEDEQWLDFVCDCRDGKTVNDAYDIIIGNVADDDVFKTVDMYFRGLWSKEQALHELRYSKSNDQICIVKQEVIHTHLKFIESYQVVNNYES